MAETRARFPWGLTIVCVPALALLLGLGTWQVQRLHWKEALIAEAEAKADLPATDYRTALGRGEFARLAVDCPGLASAPYVELQTIHDGQAGVRLISACRPEAEGPVFLIDRGFIADTVSARPPVEASAATVRIEGQLREPGHPGPMALPPEGNRFFARDHEAMATALGVGQEAQPLIVYATTSSNPDWLALQPSAPPAAFANNHLGYAMTWFGLALALVGFYIALLRRRPRAATPAGDTGKSST